MRKVRKSGKLFAGVGLNDADYSTQGCEIYSKWGSMLKRCYSPTSLLKRPTYTGCSVDESWLSFMCFRSWLLTQDWEGNHLDKDLLIEGNTVYSDSTCLLIPQEVNKFMTDRERFRGAHKLGVDLQGMKFRSRCAGLGSGEIYLGLFNTEEEAHQAYLKCKGEQAIILADRQVDLRVSEALLKRYVV